MPLDTDASSIWVDRDWFRSVGGTWTADGTSARAADGHEMVVCGTGVLRFWMWGEAFCEPVRVAAHLPSIMLMGSRFWAKHDMQLNLKTGKAKIRVCGHHASGRVRRQDDRGAQLELAAAITGRSNL